MFSPLLPVPLSLQLTFPLSSIFQLLLFASSLANSSFLHPFLFPFYIEFAQVSQVQSIFTKMKAAVLVALAATVGNFLQGWDNATIAGPPLSKD